MALAENNHFYLKIVEYMSKNYKSYHYLFFCSESSDNQELCLNTTGITVAIALFIIIQVSILKYNYLPNLFI